MFKLPFPSLMTLCIGGILVSLAMFLTWGGLQYTKRQKAETEKVQAFAERDRVIGELNRVLGVNKANQETITLLKQEKSDIELALQSLEVSRKRDSVSISRLTGLIKLQENDPANKVELSPVLKSVIEQIQQQRLERQGEKK